ncbi:MAG: eukaryotic-like serine/threonine-protein kinase [Solirubrobacteraceae bacterium]|jgi:serine/threonine-protein kinase|nr:eukaryotic-like serine/threonine-protein kinase [Solirubrobacteraceae bacterium]
MQQPRRRLAGRYELAEIIGSGGMGTVYRGTDLVLDRTVAVKLLPAALAEGDPRHVARFKREARAAASLAHPSVVAVYDTGEDEATRFIVMECVNGRSLSEVLRDDAPLEPAQAVRIAARIAGALAAAHAAGIVHRDIKPGNVMVGADGAVKVLDFGIAQAPDGATLTQGTAILGTAAYIAPEQALGERADERSDIYSLGCLLYALLTGRAPFVGDSPAAVLHQQVNSDPQAPSALNRAVPHALDAIVMQMLAKSPDERPQSAAQLAEELGRAQAAPRSVAAEAPSSAPTARMSRTAKTRALGPGARAPRRHRAAAGIAVAGAALLIIAVIALGSGGGQQHSPAGARRASAAAAGTPGTSAKKAPAAARASTSASTATAQATQAQAPAQAQAPQPTTLAGAGGALASLLSQGVRAGTIDPRAAQQLSNGLADVLRAAGAGQAQDAQQSLGDLSQRLATLQRKGRVAPGAAAPLAAALASLGSALPSSAQGQGPATESEAAQPENEVGSGGGDGKHGHGHHSGD